MDSNELRSIVVDGRNNGIEDVGLTADYVLRIGGVIGEGVVVRTDGGRAAHLAPGTSLEFEASDTPVFRTFRSTRLYHLRVNGVSWDWGDPAITEDDIREIAGLAEDQTLAAGGGGGALRRGGLVDLTTEWPPELRVVQTRSVAIAAAVPVIVNGRALTLERDEVTFEDMRR